MNETKKLKRYIVEMDMYVYARDDNHARSKATMIAKRQDDQYGNGCKVMTIFEQPFGSAMCRKVSDIVKL